MSLYCPVYTSISNQKMSDDNLKDLLKKSRLKNATLAITGMLLYLDPFFIQILEGEEAIVNESFKIIKQDSRSPSEIEKMLEHFLDMFKHETLF